MAFSHIFFKYANVGARSGASGGRFKNFISGRMKLAVLSVGRRDGR